MVYGSTIILTPKIPIFSMVIPYAKNRGKDKVTHLEKRKDQPQTTDKGKFHV
jgi:hypothetical protein